MAETVAQQQDATKQPVRRPCSGRIIAAVAVSLQTYPQTRKEIADVAAELLGARITVTDVSLAMSYLRDCGVVIRLGLSVPGGLSQEAAASRIALRRAARLAVEDCRGQPPAVLAAIVCSPE
jgi:hypothetical protein